MRYFIAILILIMPSLAHATQTCERGYYKPTADSECTQCPTGYYCPDDDTDDAVKCPLDTTDWNAALEECGYHPLYPQIRADIYSSWRQETVNGQPVGFPPYDKSHCVVRKLVVELQEGLWRMEEKFNTSRGDYWRGNCQFDLCYYANPGYYLSNFNWTSPTGEIYYFGFKPCTNAHPENSHYSGPGTPDDPVRTGGKKDYNDCPWACDDGYGLHDGECLPLCAAGATKFHVGDYVFNIYKDKLTSLAINIGFGDGTVCYVPLVEGSGKGALNVDYHGVIYHTSD